MRAQNEQPEEDETLWHVPLEIKLVADGKATVTHDMLTTRETIIPLKDVSNAVYKLNSETAGVCELMMGISDAWTLLNPSASHRSCVVFA